jgi:hypothetical protein
VALTGRIALWQGFQPQFDDVARHLRDRQIHPEFSQVDREVGLQSCDDSEIESTARAAADIGAESIVRRPAQELVKPHCSSNCVGMILPPIDGFRLTITSHHRFGDQQIGTIVKSRHLGCDTGLSIAVVPDIGKKPCELHQPSRKSSGPRAGAPRSVAFAGAGSTEVFPIFVLNAWDGH